MESDKGKGKPPKTNKNKTEALPEEVGNNDIYEGTINGKKKTQGECP